VAACGPGVEGVQVIDDRRFRVTAKVGIGIIRATFVIDVERDEERPPDHASLRARGKAPGSAVDGLARMDLTEGADGSTVMDWSADVTISGKLASVGSRLIEGTARKLIGQTFDCIRSKVEAAG
jgi:carbon monoxide dehydrogenase subunit G